ncbi:MAG: hypothetical protein R6W90_01265 [Ignavibacteriaceae bacterium]
MSRYFYYRFEPLDDEIKEWLALHFDLAKLRQPDKRLKILENKIIPRFQKYIQKLNKERRKILIDNGFITSYNSVTAQGKLYLLYLSDLAYW